VHKKQQLKHILTIHSEDNLKLVNSKYKIKFHNNTVILPHVDHSVTEYEMYQLCCDTKHTFLAKQSASFFS